MRDVHSIEDFDGNENQKFGKKYQNQRVSDSKLIF